MTDAELMAYLGLPETAEGLAILASITPEKRAEYEHMRWIEDELAVGRIPPGVIACNRIGRNVR